jgi:hypothetical protein
MPITSTLSSQGARYFYRSLNKSVYKLNLSNSLLSKGGFLKTPPSALN